MSPTLPVTTAEKIASADAALASAKVTASSHQTVRRDVRRRAAATQRRAPNDSAISGIANATSPSWMPSSGRRNGAPTRMPKAPVMSELRESGTGAWPSGRSAAYSTSLSARSSEPQDSQWGRSMAVDRAGACQPQNSQWWTNSTGLISGRWALS